MRSFGNKKVTTESDGNIYENLKKSITDKLNHEDITLLCF